MELKALVSFVVVVLSFAGYIPYILDIVKGKNRPHLFTWIIATLTAFVAWALQIIGGAGVGAWPMLVVSLLCVCVLILSIWRGTNDITRSDFVSLFLSLAGVYLWLFVSQPILSVILITAAETISYIPTIRKSWKDPYSENLTLYRVSMFRHALAIGALEKINLLTALYPAAWALANLLITLILLSRRRVVVQTS